MTWQCDSCGDPVDDDEIGFGVNDENDVVCHDCYIDMAGGFEDDDYSPGDKNIECPECGEMYDPDEVVCEDCGYSEI